MNGLVRSERARRAMSAFYERFNDVDIYVEDTAVESKKIYCELISRALAHRFSVSQIFPLGSKDVVIAHCQADQGVRTRPALYIVDGDYDLLTSVPDPALKRFYRLKRYSIENYLIDPAALVDILADESTVQDIGHIEKNFDFEGWVNHVQDPLERLTLACVVAHISRNGLPTVNVDLGLIRGLRDDFVDPQKVATFVASYEAATDAKRGAGVFANSLSQISARTVDSGFIFVRNYLPAKIITMPLIFSRVRRKFRIQTSNVLLKCKLARRCDLGDIRDIEVAIG